MARKQVDPSEVLRPYAQSRPTAFDAPGLRAQSMGHGQLSHDRCEQHDDYPPVGGHDCDDTDRRAWLVGPCQQTRDSGILDRTNFAALVAMLEKIDPNGQDHEVHRFGHWGPGWFEIVIVRPGTPAAQEAAEAACAMESYPVLDDDAYSQLECEEADAAWRDYLASDVRHDVTKRLRRLTGMRIYIGEEAHDTIREWAEETGRVESSDEGPSVCIYDRDIRRGMLAILAWPGVEIDGRPVAKIDGRAILSRAQRRAVNRVGGR